ACFSREFDLFIFGAELNHAREDEIGVEIAAVGTELNVDRRERILAFGAEGALFDQGLFGFIVAGLKIAGEACHGNDVILLRIFHQFLGVRRRRGYGAVFDFSEGLANRQSGAARDQQRQGRRRNRSRGVASSTAAESAASAAAGACGFRNARGAAAGNARIVIAARGPAAAPATAAAATARIPSGASAGGHVDRNLLRPRRIGKDLLHLFLIPSGEGLGLPEIGGPSGERGGEQEQAELFHRFQSTRPTDAMYSQFTILVRTLGPCACLSP